jgi:glycine/D-amino acid oxidase-like deaminating enzyme
MEQQVDVVVVGAGPVGLLTAIELILGGAGVLVLERLAAASLDMKAGGLGPLGLEALGRRGMAEAIAAAEARSFAAMVEAGGAGQGVEVQRPFCGPLPDPKGRAEGAATAFPPRGSAGPRSHAGRPRALSKDRRAPRV